MSTAEILWIATPFVICIIAALMYQLTRPRPEGSNMRPSHRNPYRSYLSVDSDEVRIGVPDYQLQEAIRRRLEGGDGA